MASASREERSERRRKAGIRARQKAHQVADPTADLGDDDIAGMAALGNALKARRKAAN